MILFSGCDYIIIAICDDISFQAENLKGIIKSCLNGRAASFHIFSNGHDLSVYTRTEKSNFDIIFLDVLMPGIDGIATAKLIRETDETVPIVFVTSSDDYAKEGYEVDAVSYLIKPVDKQKMKSVLDKIAKKRLNKPKQLLIINVGGVLNRIPLDSVTFIEKSGRKTAIHRLGDSTILCNQSIREIERSLENNSNFIICRQMNYVNIRHINTIDYHKRVICMTDGTQVNVSRERIKPVMEAFLDKFGEEK